MSPYVALAGLVVFVLSIVVFFRRIKRNERLESTFAALRPDKTDEGIILGIILFFAFASFMTTIIAAISWLAS